LSQLILAGERGAPERETYVVEAHQQGTSVNAPAKPRVLIVYFTLTT
jgi:hypothetical protein